jgi:IclR family transcriptional regulator, KDG regulon repressor
MRLVSALDRGCRLIELLIESDEPLVVGEIASKLGVPLSTTYELVHTLLHHGFVEEVGGGDGNVRVALGFRLFEAGAGYTTRVSFLDDAQNAAREAAAEVRETAHVAVLDGDHVIWIARAESPQPSPIRIFSYVGGREPAHVSALGKCLLSDLTLEELKERLGDGPLEVLTPNTIAGVDALFEHLKKVKRTGYAVDEEESVVGLRCVAVPIRGPDGLTRAALSTSVPAFRLSKTQIPETARLLRRYADSLEQTIRTSRLASLPGR